MFCGDITLIVRSTRHAFPTLIVCGPLPLASEAENIACHRDISRPHLRGGRRGAGTQGWTHNDSWAAKASRVVALLTPWQGSSNVESFEVYDSWLTPRVNVLTLPVSVSSRFRQWPADIFEDVSTDDTNISDVFIEDGIWDDFTGRHGHITVHRSLLTSLTVPQSICFFIRHV